jgi:hypothetical protein
VVINPAPRGFVRYGFEGVGHVLDLGEGLNNINSI